MDYLNGFVCSEHEMEEENSAVTDLVFHVKRADD